jgi:hypothetical protein
MVSPIQSDKPIPGVEYYKDNGTTTQVERASSSSTNNVGERQQTMTKAVWLACIGLGLAYTTAFQQNACTTAIVKHIDDELGMSF